MNLLKRMVILLGFVLTLTVSVQIPVQAQTITNADDGTTLKQIIVFGRHSIRSSTVDPSKLSYSTSVDPFPQWEVAAGCLTPRGSQAATLLGTYFRQYLLHEGLLTGSNQKDSMWSYFRSNSVARSYETAEAFGTGLIPDTTIPVHSFQINPSPGVADPVFDPIRAKVAKVDSARAVREIKALFNSGEALASAYSGEFSLIRSTLFDYPLGTQPPPPKPDYPPNLIDVTANTIPLTANPPLQAYTGNVINIGGLLDTINAADPFVMQYADNFDLDQVAWNRLTLDQISQQTRLISLYFGIEVLSPYLDQVQSSNAASHVLRTMQQIVEGRTISGAFGDARSRQVIVISSDGYVAGLAGLLHAHWQLPGYQPDFCAPGGALVFELRQSKKTKNYLVRVFYTAQTFDQLRNLTPLALDQPPATMQLLIPGGSNSATNMDIDFKVFQKLVGSAIGQQYVENPSREVPPAVLTGVTCP